MESPIRGLIDSAVDTVSSWFSEGAKGSMDGARAGKGFTKKGMQQVIDANKAANNGQTVCANCGTQTVPGKKSQRGVSPPRNETQIDHIILKSKGGDGSPSNGQLLCRTCNRSKSDTWP